MHVNKEWIYRIAGIVMIAFGVVLGVTWNSAKLCIGDKIFSALGLPAWSNGTSGSHYPAMIGTFLILIGIGAVNSTLQKKIRLWGWTIAILVLVIFNLVFAYI